MATIAELARSGLPYFVVVDADITQADRAVLERRGLHYRVRVDETGNSVTPGPSAVGGELLLTGETNGFATDFTYATDASRVAVKTAGVVVSQGLDAFYQNAGTSPKQVWDVAGNLVWSPHNMFLNSNAPVTQSVTTVVGQNYTVTVTGSGSMTGSAGASGVATAGSPLTFTATTTTSTFTKAGTVTQIQMNRGAVATAYLATTAAIRNGLAVDYDPVTHAPKGLLTEPAATNLLLNNAALSTQSVTVTAAAHTLSFFGTGTITLSGVSTAGPLVGTGVSNRVSLTFTPTAGSLTCTVSGTVSMAQLETGAYATSPIPTFAASATRAVDNYSFLLSTIPALGTDYSFYGRFSTPNNNANAGPFSLTDGTANNFAQVKVVGGFLYLYVTTGGTNVVNAATSGVYVANTVESVAARIKQDDFAISRGGAAVVTDVLGALPTVTKVVFGSNISSSTAVYLLEKMVIVTPSWNNTTLQTKSVS